MGEATKRADGPVRVPAEVLRGLEAVRRADQRVMLDRMSVQVRAMELGYSETACWIADHPGPYADGVLKGFVVGP